MQPCMTFTQIAEAARKAGPVPMAVAMPHDPVSIETIIAGRSEGMVCPQLFGCRETIVALLTQAGADASAYEIVDSENPVQACVDSVRSGKNRLLMKGSVATPKLLGACLSKTSGINVGRVVSSITLSAHPAMERMIAISDCGVNILPTVEQKADIIRNMIDLFHALGLEEPKIAVLSSLEEVSTKILSTVDASILTQMNRRGQIKGAIIDGPLALDNILSAQAAKKKGIDSPVAGQADGIIVPSVETGNVLAKSMVYFGGATNASVVMGAKVPIILPSRAGKPEAKLASLALGVLAARY